MGENVTGGLQHMGALRPDLPIEAMVKIKMVAVVKVKVKVYQFQKQRQQTEIPGINSFALLCAPRSSSSSGAR